MSFDHFDHLERRCPRLGHPITFTYCRTCEPDHRPCFKVFDCWWEQFDVQGYFHEILSEKAFSRLANPKPPDKVASLLDLIEQARQRLDDDEDI